MRAQVMAARGAERLRAIVVARDLDPEQIEAIEADRSLFLLDGVEIVEGRRRQYKGGVLAAHLLGYLNEIGPAQLRAAESSGNALAYQRGDLIGRSGIELAFESVLRGRDGSLQVVVDAKGRRIRDGYATSMLLDSALRAAEPGANIFLTLAAGLQRRAEAAFLGQAGAIVALDPRTGEVLVAASFPTFDPNRIGGPLSRETLALLDGDSLKPRFDRVNQGQYSPGSTFKVATALAALQGLATSGDEGVVCPGFFRLGHRAWRCHKDTGHGRVDLKDALKRSCDTYFYHMAARIGIDAIATAARQLGMGKTLGIGVPEKPGLIPDRAYHDRVETGGYQRGMDLNAAIGQGSVLVTPLQLAVAYAALVNGGTVWQPHVLLRVETADFRVTRRTAAGQDVLGDAPRVLQRGEPWALGHIDPGPLAKIKAGLLAVTGEPGGTGYTRRSQVVTMGGKTGTAQVVALGRDRVEVANTPYEERDHALFVGFAPADDPEIVVAVVNEHSGHGGSQAEPIAVAVIDAYFAQRAAVAQVQ